MVAELPAAQAAAQVPKKHSLYTTERIPILTKRKARNLYLFEDAGPKRISEECGLTYAAAQKLVSREGWVKERRARYASLVKKADARMGAVDEEVIEAIASHSEEYALRALQKTGEALERKDPQAAKDAQAYSATVKNLAGVARLMRAPAGSDGGSSNPEVNIFLLRAGDVAPAEPKQVTEVTTKTVQ